MQDKETVLAVRGLRVAIDAGGGPFTVNYGSFEVNKGDFMLVTGKNGSGKSTFLRLFRLQDEGYFSVDGGAYFLPCSSQKSVHEYSDAELTALNRMVAYIGQEDRFQTYDSAYSAIFTACKTALEGNRSLSRAERAQKLEHTDELIQKYFKEYLSTSFRCTDFNVFKRKKVYSWSGGQQKMINVLAGIIKAQVCNLSLLVMDEPLNNLDGANKYVVSKVVEELVRGGNIAIIAVTHCQIFKGINKVLNITKDGEVGFTAALTQGEVKYHADCVEIIQPANKEED